MRADDGLRIAAGAFVGAKSGIIATSITAEAPLFGLRNAGYTPPGALVAVNRPIGISQIRVKIAPVTAITVTGSLSMTFEMHKATSTSQFTGGTASTAVVKKSSGYPLIPLTEIDTMVANTAPLAAGGYIVVGDSPIDMQMALVGSTIDAIWWFEDGLPLVIEQNEGLLLHVVEAMSAGSFRLFVGIDFYRF